MLPCGRRVHLHKSASFKMLFEKIKNKSENWCYNCSQNDRKINSKTTQNMIQTNYNKYHPKGAQRHRTGSQRSRKGAAKGPQSPHPRSPQYIYIGHWALIPRTPHYHNSWLADFPSTALLHCSNACDSKLTFSFLPTLAALHEQYLSSSLLDLDQFIASQFGTGLFYKNGLRTNRAKL